MNKSTHFICLGAHKCGTSWLFNCLYEHPDIYVKDKIDYFYNNQRYALKEEWYSDQFLQKKMITGELSTVYLFKDKTNSVAKRIFEFNPKIKLLVLLRNPIDRAYAHYLQDIKIGHITSNTSFKKAIEENPNLLFWGKYKEHLETYFSYFEKEQIKILLFDDLKDNSEKLITEVYSFVGAETNFIPKSLQKKINSARIPKYSNLDVLKRKTSDLLRKSLVGEKIWWQLKHSSFAKQYYALNSSKHLALKLTNTKTRQELYSYFKEDIEYVKSLLSRNDLNWH